MIKEPEIKDKRIFGKNSNICVVIPTFNQYEVTKHTLLKLQKQTINFDILIVDNNSNDDTYEKLQKEFENINIILAKENYGGAGGLYLGEKFAYNMGYDYIILSDNDAIPIDDDLIEEIVKNCDEEHIVDFINEAEETQPSLRIFHYGCFHRKVIEKIGFVDYKMFIYGDDVDYALRLEEFGIKRKKINKKYWHPMKYHYSTNRVYFEIRNELENAKRHKKRRIHTIKLILSRMVFFLFYERTKFFVMLKAINDWFFNNWDNSFIYKKIKNDIKYKIISIDEFNKLIKANCIFVVCHKRIKSIIKHKYYCYNLIKCFKNLIKNPVIIQNVYTFPSLFVKKFFYIVSIENNNIAYFEISNNLLINFILIVFLLPFIGVFMLIIFLSIILKSFFNKNPLPDYYREYNYQAKIYKSNILQKKNNICVVILAYNQLENVKKIASFYKEQINIVDVLFIDNSSTDGTYEYLINNFKNDFNIIKTNKNYGGAGGFAIGQEWVINRGYEYCILTEEDAYPLDNNIIKKLVEKVSLKSIVKSKFFELNTTSFTLHFTLYPIKLFKLIGVMNSNLFFRADDWEYAKRIEVLLKKGIFKEVVVDVKYSHPIIKEGFGIMANYFSFRNGLLVYSKRPRKNSLIEVSLIFIKDLWYSIFSYLYDKNVIPLKQFFYAYKDYLCLDLSKNFKRIQQFSGSVLKPKNIELRIDSFENFFTKYSNFKFSSKTLRENVELKKYIKKKEKNKKFFTIGIKYAGISRVLTLWNRDIVFIEDMDFINKKIKYFEYRNNVFKSRLLIIVSLSLTMLIYVLSFLLIVLTILRINFAKN